MGSLPEPHKVLIEMDERRVACGDLRAVSVSYLGDIGRDRIPANVPGGDELELATRSDGRKEIIPRGWRSLRLGRSGSSFYSLWWRGKDVERAEVVERLTEHAEDLLRRNGRSPDSYNQEQWVKLLNEVNKRLAACAKADQDLETYLLHGEPEKRRTDEPRKDLTLAVRAALLADPDLFTLGVRPLTSRDVGERLGIKTTPTDEDRGENRAALRATNDGRELLETYHGARGLAELKQRLRHFQEEAGLA